jgi:hypothetical protein
MVRKGQIEFIVILGLIVVIAVVVFYASQSGLLNPVVSTDVSLAQDSVKNLIRTGAYQTLSSINLHGGYLDPDSFQMGSVTFNGKDIPYWQKNGEIKYPDIHSNFKDGLVSYLTQNKDDFASAYMDEYGKELVIGDPVVVANFMGDKIELLVTMTTTLDGDHVPQPYSVSIPTMIEEIRDFSTNFLTYSSANRPLEYFTLGSVLFSPINDGEHDVPFYIHLTQCGEVFYKNWFDLKPGMEKVIKTTLAHTYMPGKYPLNVLRTTSHPKYAIPPINGKDYKNIDVSFHLPDDFELYMDTFQFNPDPIFVKSEIIPMAGICQANPVFVKYHLMYPAVVKVKDPLTGVSFQFVTEVFIFNNTPGDVADLSGYDSSPSKAICENPGCPINIRVQDSGGEPISGASVTFMNCLLGRTDSSGAFTQNVPCGIGSLQIYKSGGFGIYEEMKSYEEIINFTIITLYKTPSINLHFYEVEVQDLSLVQQYMIDERGVNYINTKHPDQFVYLNFYRYSDNQFDQRVFDDKVGRVTDITAGEYYITGSLASEENVAGGIVTEYTITEDMDGKDLYVYMPYMPAGFSQSDQDNVNEDDMNLTEILTGVLDKCSLGPITASPVEDFKGCVVSYGEL